MDKLPPMAPLIADRGEQLVSAYKTVKRSGRGGHQVPADGGIPEVATESGRAPFTELRADIEQIVIAEAWKVDTHFYANRVAILFRPSIPPPA